MWVRAAAAESRRSRRRNDDALASLQPSGRGTEFAGPRGDSPTIQMNTAVPQARGPGGGERIRTVDFYIANVALYQLSYTPKKKPILARRRAGPNGRRRAEPGCGQKTATGWP